eukprot:IDg4102t1
MASQTMILSALLFAVFCGMSLAQAGTGPRKLVAVTAGTTSTNIGELTKSPPLKICPADYSSGISIRCEGNGVRPPVKMYIEGQRVQTEGRAPYHIAGDIDGGGSLQKVFVWDDYLNISPKPNGNRRFRIKCMYVNPSGDVKTFSRPLIIEADGCGATSSTKLRSQLASNGQVSFECFYSEIGILDINMNELGENVRMEQTESNVQDEDLVRCRAQGMSADALLDAGNVSNVLSIALKRISSTNAVFGATTAHEASR